MSFRLVIRRVARLEFDEAFDWYEGQRAGLGFEFADRVRAVYDRIQATPEMHGLIHKDVRKALVERFPYAIFYRIRGDRVVVLSVFHGKRDPTIWKSRV